MLPRNRPTLAASVRMAAFAHIAEARAASIASIVSCRAINAVDFVDLPQRKKTVLPPGLAGIT